MFSRPAAASRRNLGSRGCSDRMSIPSVRRPQRSVSALRARAAVSESSGEGLSKTIERSPERMPLRVPAGPVAKVSCVGRMSLSPAGPWRRMLSNEIRADSPSASECAAEASRRNLPPIESGVSPSAARSNDATSPAMRSRCPAWESAPSSRHASRSALLCEARSPARRHSSSRASSEMPPRLRPRYSARARSLRRVARIVSSSGSNPRPPASMFRSSRPSESAGRKRPSGKLSQRSTASYSLRAASNVPERESRPVPTPSAVEAVIRPCCQRPSPRSVMRPGMAIRRCSAVSGSSARRKSICRSVPSSRTASSARPGSSSCLAAPSACRSRCPGEVMPRCRRRMSARVPASCSDAPIRLSRSTARSRPGTNRAASRIPTSAVRSAVSGASGARARMPAPAFTSARRLDCVVAIFRPVSSAPSGERASDPHNFSTVNPDRSAKRMLRICTASCAPYERSESISVSKPVTAMAAGSNPAVGRWSAMAYCARLSCSSIRSMRISHGPAAGASAASGAAPAVRRASGDGPSAAGPVSCCASCPAAGMRQA